MNKIIRNIILLVKIALVFLPFYLDYLLIKYAVHLVPPGAWSPLIKLGIALVMTWCTFIPCIFLIILLAKFVTYDGV
jgi:hypothetical protein